MVKKFEKSLLENCGCSPSENYLLAVSGGIDSVVMAHLFLAAGYTFDLAHCNFALRGEESDSDQLFIQNLAAGWQVRCYVRRFDTAVYAAEKGVSVQMAARDLRYAWFAELASTGFDSIAVAHNLNDSVETLLLNLARGCGIRGLTGISARQGHIIRPLLFASREEILEYAGEHKLAWREDSSNASDKYLRNRIRHHIIPEFTALNPAFLVHVSDLMKRLGHTELLFNYCLEEIRKQACTGTRDRLLIDMNMLETLPANETVLYELLRDFGCTDQHIGPIIASFSSIPGKRFFTATHCVTRDRTHLVVTPIEKPDDEELLIRADTLAISRPLRLTFRPIENREDFDIPKDPAFATLDFDLLEFPLTLRRWKNGDSFHPFGMKGHKKISDFLIDSKIPMPDKSHVWVLESAGRIAWLVNFRIDERFRITPGTRRILQIACLNETDGESDNQSKLTGSL
jgi:tRNA(Ile)-lysidine synthase